MTALLACAAPRAAAIPKVALHASDGRTVQLDAVVRASRLAVVTFFSASCPCQRAHDARLRELADRYRSAGVAFVAVDSESTSTDALDAEEARRRGLSFPLLTDPRGVVADALGADYATFTVVVDQDGRVRYRGALDSDHTDLHPDATLYLRDALDDLLAGRAPRAPSTEALGCVLRRR